MATTKTELAAPAGSPEALDAAIGEGADAVYLGLKDFSASNARCANFTYPQFEGALRSLRRMWRKLYVAVNTVFQQREADRVYQLLKYLAGQGPDAVLVQDLGIISMARAHFPSLRLFASKRLNVASSRGANLLSRHGFSQATLARELSLDEIRDIRANTNIELGVFVHGALCISVSGLCLFSSYLGGKSANRGICTQACRRFYTARSGDGDEEGGGCYFSPSDLELIGQVPDLARAGVNSFKIDGRTKSAEYVGTVVSAYRLVLDSLDAGEERLNQAIAEAGNILKNDFARPKTVYLINGAGIPRCGGDGGEMPGWLNPHQNAGAGKPWAMGKRYAPVIRGAGGAGRGPGRDRAPLPAGGKGPGKDGAGLPPGIYAMVSRLEDIYVLQAARPVKLILPYSRKLSKLLLGGREKPLPFPAGDIILSLDPFFPQEQEAELGEDIPALAERGYRHFIANNLGHFSLFRTAEAGAGARKKARPIIIAGPWLYAFNAWAWDFALACGAEYCVSPLENNRQNLERSFLQEEHSQGRRPGAGRRSQVFITIFARPSLFRIRADLGRAYDFKNFSGSRDEAFRLAPDSEGTMVYPWQPFSIVDKTPFLREAGFSRFILDFSSGPLKKAEYKEIMEAANRAAPLPGTGRFNWKNGFFAQQ